MKSMERQRITIQLFLVMLNDYCCSSVNYKTPQNNFLKFKREEEINFGTLVTITNSFIHDLHNTID